MSDTANKSEEGKVVSGAFRVGMMRERHPELSKKLARAQYLLAAAIIAMDDAEDIPGRHNLQEQMAVERLMIEYAATLADLVRGEEDSCA